MCFGGSPPKPEKPAPPPPPAPAPAADPPPAPMAPPPELVNADEKAPKVTKERTARSESQQAAQGTSSLTIPVNTGSGAAKGGPKGSLNIPT